MEELEKLEFIKFVLSKLVGKIQAHIIRQMLTHPSCKIGVNLVEPFFTFIDKSKTSRKGGAVDNSDGIALI